MISTNGQVSEPVNDDGRNNVTSQKARDILEACKWRNTAALQALAATDCGFMTDDLRRQAWPVLLGVPFEKDDLDDTEKPQTGGDWKELPRHRDEDQVQLDTRQKLNSIAANESFPTSSPKSFAAIHTSATSKAITTSVKSSCSSSRRHYAPLRLRASPPSAFRGLHADEASDPTVDHAPLIPDILAGRDPFPQTTNSPARSPSYAPRPAPSQSRLSASTMFASIVLSRRDELLELAQDPDNDPAAPPSRPLQSAPSTMELERPHRRHVRPIRRPPSALPPGVAPPHIGGELPQRRRATSTRAPAKTMQDGEAFVPPPAGGAAGRRAQEEDPRHAVGLFAAAPAP
ncbi:conserved hypothetical protein [Verticillium alfalfae VaMs.102]|uniref:Rab-GAP TBC domain-containing protein n=1 Tax=Verticillium alfalfae (strain VaMs.102 / ATCC MYA-4576 / FGSC 10136) TaxID=526221 RepID=C9S755_VERA1|nr:conserved hypothetical protein [Verticillium alfalfae VaMs.102]EEY14640.1 conserved hypothetical protein [Verticillium alfalfae VaMs.102]